MKKRREEQEGRVCMCWFLHFSSYVVKSKVKVHVLPRAVRATQGRFNLYRSFCRASPCFSLA